MLYVLAGALSASLASMLTVWALNTPFPLSCMSRNLRHLLCYQLTHLSVTAKVGDLNFYVCHETRAAPRLWLYVIETTTYYNLITLFIIAFGYLL